MPILDYARGRIPWWHRRAVRRWALALALALLLAGLFFLPGPSDAAYGCDHCGSLRRVRHWWFGITSEHGVQSSSLDAWMRQRRIAHTHQWVFCSESGRNLLGMRTFIGCGSAPWIVRYAHQLDPVLNTATDEEVAELLSILRAGPESQRMGAWEAAMDRAATRPTR